MRALTGTTLYGTSIPNGTDGVALVTGASQNDPTGDPRVRRRAARPLATTSRRNHPELLGQRLHRGRRRQRQIFGQLGNDVIQGDGVRRRPDRAADLHARPDGRLDALPALLADGPAGTRIGAWRHAGGCTGTAASTRSATRSARSSSTRRSRRRTDGERLHRGQRRQRHDLRRPRPGRHRRRQLRPLRPRRRVRHDRRPDRHVARRRHLGRRHACSRSRALVLSAVDRHADDPRSRRPASP